MVAKVSITNSLVAKLKPRETEYDVRDVGLKGFMIRVNPTGTMSYVVQYARGKRVNLGKVGVLTPKEAREKAVDVLANFAKGIDPKQAERQAKGIPTLKTFLDTEYGPWVKAHNPSGKEALKIIERHFKSLYDRPLNQIKVQDMEKWRTQKLETKAMQANTINRIITPLRSTLSKAVEWGVIPENGLNGLKILKHDDTRVRYLSEKERKRLFEALQAREVLAREKRNSANQWREERGYPQRPELKANEYCDHLQPMIILSLNTGIRKGELLALKRSQVNFEQATLFIEKSKNYLARHVPLNKTAIKTLKIWLEQTQALGSVYLFPSPVNIEKPISSVKKAWMNVRDGAKIVDFHWHDLRHDFASNLVMKGVSLYVVQKLLGHKKIDQTMKYAHLAPDFIAESVAKLD